MRKIFFAHPIFLSIIFLICFGCHTLPPNHDAEHNPDSLPNSFDPSPAQMAQPPIEFNEPLKHVTRAPYPSFPKRIIMVGLEGLNWDVLNHLAKNHEQAPHIAKLLKRGVRASLQTGLTGYATPAKCWKLLLTGKPLSLPDQPFLWDMVKAKRIALLDVPYSAKENASGDLFFSRYSLNAKQLNRYPPAFKTDTGLDNAAYKFGLLKGKDYDLAIVNIDQPDKTQHRALLGYVIESMRGTKGLTIDPEFRNVFLRNKGALQLVYQDLDRLAKYLLDNFPEYLVILFSVHGHRLSPYEIRMEFNEDWFDKLKIKGRSNTSELVNVEIDINGNRLSGKQRTSAKLIEVLKNDETGKATKLRLVYKRWEFDLPAGKNSIFQKNSLHQSISETLSDCNFSEKKIFRVGYRENKLIIEPVPEVLRMLCLDDAYRYCEGIEIIRVQSGHPASADGIFVAMGPMIQSNRKLEPISLTDLLSYVFYYSDDHPAFGIVPKPIGNAVNKID